MSPGREHCGPSRLNLVGLVSCCARSIVKSGWYNVCCESGDRDGRMERYKLQMIHTASKPLLGVRPSLLAGPARMATSGIVDLIHLSCSRYQASLDKLDRQRFETASSSAEPHTGCGVECESRQAQVLVMWSKYPRMTH